jgi:hypothetical protein
VGNPPADQPISLAELDARHDELLSQLEELDQRVQTVLKQHLPAKAAGPPSPENAAATPVLSPHGTDSGVPPLTCGDPGAPIC